MPIIEVLTQNGLTVRFEKGRLAVSPKAKITESLRIYILEQRENLIREIQTEALQTLLSSNLGLKEQFEFEVEERVSIMMMDGNLSESEAANHAQNATTNLWLKTFIESI